ncbi:hypothetical protein ACU61A_23180 [Pseudonocardia sichuanensis]
MITPTTLPILIGAAIGAGGAIFAQVIAALFTARREAARLAWDKSKQDRDWKLRDADRLLAAKQTLYSRYISLLYRPVMDTVQLTRKEYATTPNWHDLVPAYVGPLADEIDDLRWNIRLVGSPVVAERVEYSNAALLVAVSEAGRPDRSSLDKRHELAARALTAWRQVSEAMRADIRGDDVALERIHREVSASPAGSEQPAVRAGDSDGR